MWHNDEIDLVIQPTHLPKHFHNSYRPISLLPSKALIYYILNINSKVLRKSNFTYYNYTINRPTGFTVEITIQFSSQTQHKPPNPQNRS